MKAAVNGVLNLGARWVVAEATRQVGWAIDGVSTRPIRQTPPAAGTEVMPRVANRQDWLR
jgi:hypothetical protein